jgi:N6-adenosine-specific RNA methylase IME4
MPIVEAVGRASALPHHYGAIYADPPWHFLTWSLKRAKRARHPSEHYDTMSLDAIKALSIDEVAAPDCSLFIWISWPMLRHGLEVIDAWGFTYKTCAFAWIKAHAGQLEMFHDEIPDQMGLGYWTRANSEVCLLATRGLPKRLDAGVRQAIIEPRREHSRKPDCVYSRIERLVAGPYLELFARSTRPGWISWGNEVGRFGEVTE